MGEREPYKEREEYEKLLTINKSLKKKIDSLTRRFADFINCPHIDCMNNVKTFYEDDSGHCQLSEAEISEDGYCRSYIKWDEPIPVEDFARENNLEIIGSYKDKIYALKDKSLLGKVFEYRIQPIIKMDKKDIDEMIKFTDIMYMEIMR